MMLWSQTSGTRSLCRPAWSRSVKDGELWLLRSKWAGACTRAQRVAWWQPLIFHCVCVMTALPSADSIGMDADRLEFRFRSSGDKLDVACSQAVVPSTWLVVSRMSGPTPTLIKNVHWCCDHHARIEGPDHSLQLSQLAGVHAHWTATIEAGALEETGPRISAVAVESHPSNVHLTCEVPLFRAPKAIVPVEALALQCHDQQMEQEMLVPAAQATGSQRALAGPSNPALVVAPRGTAAWGARSGWRLDLGAEALFGGSCS